MGIRRLFELDPRAARPYILAEIRRPQAASGNWLPAALAIFLMKLYPSSTERWPPGSKPPAPPRCLTRG